MIIMLTYNRALEAEQVVPRLVQPLLGLVLHLEGSPTRLPIRRRLNLNLSLNHDPKSYWVAVSGN